MLFQISHRFFVDSSQTEQGIGELVDSQTVKSVLHRGLSDERPSSLCVLPSFLAAKGRFGFFFNCDTPAVA